MCILYAGFSNQFGDPGKNESVTIRSDLVPYIRPSGHFIQVKLNSVVLSWFVFGLFWLGCIKQEKTKLNANNKMQPSI